MATGWEPERLDWVQQEQMVGPDAGAVAAPMEHIYPAGDRPERRLPGESVGWDHPTAITRDLKAELTVAVNSRPNPVPASRPLPHHGVKSLRWRSGEVGCADLAVDDDLVVGADAEEVTARGSEQADRGRMENQLPSDPVGLLGS